MSGKPASANPLVPFVESTLEVMLELAEVLGDEVRLLKKNDVESIKALLLRKGRLVVHYQSNMKNIIANPELLAQVPAEMRSKLKIRGTKLAEVSERNATALQAAVGGTRRLIDHIIKIVRDEAMPRQSYNDPRTAHLELGSYSPTCRPVAINQTA